MRKLLIAFSVFVLVAGVANAQTQDVKKAADTKKECGKCPAATAAAKECPGMTAAQAGEAKAACDHAKTSEMSADCKAKAEGTATAEVKACCKEAGAVAKSEEKAAGK